MEERDGSMVVVDARGKTVDARRVAFNKARAEQRLAQLDDSIRALEAEKAVIEETLASYTALPDPSSE
jgi:uncharacterized protein YfcZ (UPF0381/DUF406 family)